MATGYLIGHRAATVEQLLQRRTDPHFGLVFDRFLGIWSGPIDAPVAIKPLRDSLHAFVERFNQGRASPAVRSLLDDHHRRLDRVPASFHVKSIDLRVQWRFTTGLGAAHPTENGFSFDDLIGVPYITGSAAKGLCRAAAQVFGAEYERVRQLLGPEGEDGSACGDLIFVDALPIA